jgi:hypothetical protein
MNLHHIARLMKEGKYRPGFFADRPRKKNDKAPMKCSWKYSKGAGTAKYVDCDRLVGLDKDHKIIGIEHPDAEIWYLNRIDGRTFLTNDSDYYIKCEYDGTPVYTSFNTHNLTIDDRKLITTANRKYRKTIRRGE